MTGRAVIIVAAMALCALLPGCTAVSSNYVHLEPPKAIYYQQMCANSGPPDIVYFPYGKIFLSALLTDSNVSIGIHVPQDNTVILEDMTVAIGCQYGRTDGTQSATLVPDDSHREIQDANESDYFAYFYGGSDTPSASAKVLTGSTRDGYNRYRLPDVPVYQGYMFRAPLSGQLLPDEGCLKFPTMRINGIIVKGPAVPFHRRHWTGLSPVCM